MSHPETTTRRFSPPTADQIRAHLARHRPRPNQGAARWWGWMGMLGASLVMLAVFPMNLFSWALPSLVGVGFSIDLAMRGRRLRRVENQVAQVEAMAMLSQWAGAMRAAWRLLPRTATILPLQRRLVSVMAQVLDRLSAHDAALVAYDDLLADLPEKDPGALRLRVRRAAVLLESERLTDADDVLQRLRGRIQASSDPLVRAEFALAQLLQMVRTGHQEQAVEAADDVGRQLRPLGVEAAQGYALLALAHHQRAQRAQEIAGEDSDEAEADSRPLRERAQRLWRDATLLRPANTLVETYPELEAITRDPSMRAAVWPDLTREAA